MLEFDNNLQYWRRQRCLTQEALAKLSGLTQNTLSELERGNYLPRLYTAYLLAECLNVTVEDLWSPDDVLHTYNLF